ncbi:MAG: nicotinate-nucleotide adenylyltransferase [Opitutales bacterium]|jgi:nicotinate-nucleotide adenylyltransferase
MLREKRRIGFFGGTFDPFHSGHLGMAHAAAEALHLDNVSFVPAGQNPLKDEAPRTSPRQRVDMIRLGIQPYRRYGIWEGELDRQGLSYTLDTIEHVQRVYPNCHMFWIIGSDQLPHLPRWYGIEQLVEKVGFILVRRPGFEFSWPGIKGLSLYPVDNPLMEVSATEIRDRIRRGEPVRGMVPPVVDDYIRRNSLYI